MQVWHFSEMAYHPAWEHLGDSYRVIVPNRLFDPKIGADLYHRYLDEWALCDELGINIMTNEHHATATCADSVCTIPMAILARETKKVRLLALGMPIGNRNDPIRVAEEYSIIDVISRGRLDMGFVKGVPFEISPANTNPADLVDRFWEAHDLILKAMTSHDGPFNWEGTHFHYRSVNVWPRPYQEPHPPVWMPVGSAGQRRRGGRARHHDRRPQHRLGPHPGDLRRLPQKGARGRPRADPRQARLYGADRGRQHPRGGPPPRRPDPRLQPDLGHRRAAIRQPAGLCPGRGRGADAEGRRRDGGARDPRPAEGRHPDQPAHDVGRGRDRRRPLLRRHPRRRVRPAKAPSTTMSAASATS